MKTSTKAVVALVVAVAAASALKHHTEQPASAPATAAHVDPATSADASARSVSTHRTPPAPVTTPRHAKQPASPDWGAVTEHMVHTTPGADLPIPWEDGVRHTATCSNGVHAEWVGTSTAAELCEPYHVIEQH